HRAARAAGGRSAEPSSARTVPRLSSRAAAAGMARHFRRIFEMTRRGPLRRPREEFAMSTRLVQRIARSKPTIEGAGVKLRRAFGFGSTREFDPFLLLDDFRNDRPDDYLPGFPWHPHRGIETITYVLASSVEHGDSIGNRGSIGAKN